MPPRQQLRALYDEGDGYHALLFASQTKMPYAVAATAWTKMLTCGPFTPAALEAIRSFRATHTDKGPEFIP